MTQESGFATPEEMRNKALQRLAVAAVVTTGALAALWWLDQSGAPRQPVRKLAVKPAPITSAPEIAPPGVSEPVAAPETAKPENPLEKPASPAAASPTAVTPAPRTEAPPPPRVNNAPVAPVTRPGNAAPPAPPAPIPAAQPAPAGPGFVVQVGLFSNPKNAQELVQKLARMGVKAHLEIRVQLGPFQTNAEADKAQAELRKHGVTGVVGVASSPMSTR